MADGNNIHDLGSNRKVIFNVPNLIEHSTMHLAPEVDFIHSFQPATVEDSDELPHEEDIDVIQNAKEEYETSQDINKLLADFLESIRKFVENKFDSNLVIDEDETNSFEEVDEQSKQLQKNDSKEENTSVKPDIPDELFNEDGTLKNKFDELEANKEELEKEGVTIGKRYGEGYVEIDKDGDGKYDQKAKYNESGKKIEEEIDTNGDGKLDTMVGYDENGKVIWKMADTDFDGELDLSENYSE